MIHPTEALRDYAAGELTPDQRPALEQHLTICGECATELEQLRITVAALRMLPERDIPQRIAFVSDKVFEPSPVTRFFTGFWNSATRLGFASACVLAGALIVSAYHRPAEVRTVVQTANVDVSKQVDDAVTRAVAQVRAEDARKIEVIDQKYQKEYQARMVAVEETFDRLQMRLSSVLVASNNMRDGGEGQ